MNQNNNTQGSQSPFASTQGSQTNPFTADLKGEFTSSFGTNTNTMSQIFKDGGFGGSNTGKWIAVGVFLLVVAGAGYFILSQPSEDEAMPVAADTATEEETAATEAAAEPEAVAPDAGQAVDTGAGQAAESAGVQASGSLTLVSPADSDSRTYDETSGPARFSWEGGSGTIVFSRNSSMNPVYMRVPVEGNSYDFYNPYPGTWFWRIENESGVSEVRKFRVDAPAKRSISLKSPTSGSAIAANGGVVSWNPDPERKVAFYRVEFSNDGKWTNPVYRFASSGESVQTQGMNPGQYQVRLGAFSEVAGRWEFTDPISVTVQ